MLYVEHNDYMDKQLAAQRKYDEILTEKERLFSKTQPKAITYDKEKVSGGDTTNTFDEYLTAKERKRIDQRLEEIKSILEGRTQLLRLKEQELKASKDWHDKIYIYYYLEHLSVAQIKFKVPYERTQIYRILKEINTNCFGQKRRYFPKKMGRNGTKYKIKSQHERPHNKG